MPICQTIQQSRSILFIGTWLRKTCDWDTFNKKSLRKLRVIVGLTKRRECYLKNSTLFSFAEVEADKKLAEKKQSAVNLKIAVVGGGDESPGGWDRDRNFSANPAEIIRRSPMDRSDPSRPRTTAQDRLRRDESGQLLKSRLGDKDGPPPDPAYRFALLASLSKAFQMK